MANPTGLAVGTWSGDVIHSSGGLNAKYLTGAYVKSVNSSGLVTLQQDYEAWLSANATQVSSTPSNPSHGDIIQYDTAQTSLTDHYEADNTTAITSVSASEVFGFQYHGILTRWLKYLGQSPEYTVQLSLASVASSTEFDSGSDTLAASVNQAKGAAAASASLFRQWDGLSNPVDSTQATIGAYSQSTKATLYDDANDYWQLSRADVASNTRDKTGNIYWDESSIDWGKFALSVIFTSSADEGGSAWTDICWGSATAAEASDGTGDGDDSADRWGGRSSKGFLVRFKRYDDSTILAALRLNDSTAQSNVSGLQANNYLDVTNAAHCELVNANTSVTASGNWANSLATIPVATSDTDKYAITIVTLGRKVALYVGKICYVIWTIPEAAWPSDSNTITLGSRFSLYGDDGSATPTAHFTHVHQFAVGVPDPVNVDPRTRFSNPLSKAEIQVINIGQLDLLTASQFEGAKAEVSASGEGMIVEQAPFAGGEGWVVRLQGTTPGGSISTAIDYTNGRLEVTVPGGSWTLSQIKDAIDATGFTATYLADTDGTEAFSIDFLGDHNMTGGDVFCVWDASAGVLKRIDDDAVALLFYDKMIWTGTQAEYDALIDPSPKRVHFITDA